MQFNEGSASSLLGDISLADINELSWSLLNEGASTNASPLRLPILTTRSVDSVDARVVVLRRVNFPKRTLECYTDLRSAKVSQIAHMAKTTWLFYDPSRKLQIKASGDSTLCRDVPTTDARWDDLNSHSKRAYAQTLEPGVPVDKIENGAPCASVKDPELGRSNFALIQCVVDQLEWLQLSRDGHKRALLTYSDMSWSSSWLMP